VELADEGVANGPNPGVLHLRDGVPVPEFDELGGRRAQPGYEVDRRPVREGALSAIESIMMLDAGFWRGFADPAAPERIADGELRPDWTKRGFLRAYTDHRYTFGRYFAPLSPSRPTGLGELRADNDVVLYDRQQDPTETRNLAADPANDELVARYSALLEGLITAEIGTDTRAWVTERPRLLGRPVWHGDVDEPAALATA
jgi:arylsulfatase